MEAARGVALDDEAERVAARLAAERLGRALRIALLAVRLERHPCIIAESRPPLDTWPFVTLGHVFPAKRRFTCGG